LSKHLFIKKIPWWINDKYTTTIDELFMFDSLNYDQQKAYQLNSGLKIAYDQLYSHCCHKVKVIKSYYVINDHDFIQDSISRPLD
jgi:hypothetical protein